MGLKNQVDKEVKNINMEEKYIRRKLQKKIEKEKLKSLQEKIRAHYYKVRKLLGEEP